MSEFSLSAGEHFFLNLRGFTHAPRLWSADLSEPVDVYSAWIDACES